MELNICRNWSVICKESNPWFRMWIATESDPGRLLKAKASFPEFFDDGEQPPFVPLSILKQVMQDTDAQLWGDTLGQFNIPELHWGYGENAIAEYVPDEFHNLVQTVCESCDGVYVFMFQDSDQHRIDYMGETCVVMEAWCDEVGAPEQLSAVPIRFINFMS